jgi:hypothetical protein
MRKPSAYVLGTCVFALSAAAIGSGVSYLVTYWGGHSGMVQGLVEPQTRETAAGILLSNIAFGMGRGALPALVTGMVSATFIHLLAQRTHSVMFAAFCGLAGGFLSYALIGGSEMLGTPVTAGAVAAAATGFLLWRPLRAWFGVAGVRGHHAV